MSNRINTYTCDTCQGEIVTEDLVEGTTSFMVPCQATEGCQGKMTSAFYRCDQTLTPEWEWYKPRILNVSLFDFATWDHLQHGGLLLRRKAAAKQE